MNMKFHLSFLDVLNSRTKVKIIDFLIKNFGSKYIFLDEIHYVTDWEGVLKRYYDNTKVKFVISDRSKPTVPMVQVEPMYLSQRTATSLMWKDAGRCLGGSAVRRSLTVEQDVDVTPSQVFSEHEEG